jgi:hypothetical protein
MGMKIFWGLMLLALCIGGFYVYQHYHQEKQLANGDVVCTGCMTPDEKARFDKENSGDVADGQSEHKIRTYRAEEAAGNPEGAAATGQPAAAPAPSAATAIPTPTPASIAPAPAAAAPSAPVQQVTASGVVGSILSNLPSGDSQTPNAPDGQRFGGSGKYQWYRQGNLTWRVDTANGASCIAFATLDEWRKQIVSSHGCGRGA